MTVTIEPLGDHEYLVQLSEDGQQIHSRFRADPAALADVGGDRTTEGRVVRETMDFLVEHQEAQDLPDLIDLLDVMATYQEFPEELRRRLRAVEAGEQR